jgi:hypothetical protein
MKSMLRFHASLMIAALVIASLAGAAVAGDKPKGLALGSEILMADVGMQNVDDEAVTIADVKGKNGTLVMFTCNACPWVKAWEERMVALGNAAVEKEIGVIFINSNDPKKNKEDGFEEMKKRSKKLGMGFPYVVDATSDVARAYSATRTPEAFLFDADGKLVYHGAIDDNAKKPEEVKAQYLGDALNAVANGGSIELAKTKALGCTIKFRSASRDESKDKEKS